MRFCLVPANGGMKGNDGTTQKAVKLGDVINIPFRNKEIKIIIK